MTDNAIGLDVLVQADGNLDCINLKMAKVQVLKLRSINSGGDFESYWAFRRQQSKQRLYGQNLNFIV